MVQVAQRHPYLVTTEHMYQEFGQGKEIEMSALDISTLLGENNSAVTRVLVALRKAGAAQVRYYREMQTSFIKGGGRHSAWTLLADLDTALSVVAKTYGKTLQRGGKTRASKARVQPDVWAQPKEPAVAPQTIGRSLSDLAPLRRDESHAFIEIARKFRDQRQFLVDERKRFADMGLELGEVKSVYDSNTTADLTAVMKVLPYVEQLERENERLAETNKNVYKPTQELNDMRRVIEANKAQIERLVREKGEAQNAAQEIEGNHRSQMQNMKRQYSDLEEVNRQLRQQLAAKVTTERANGTTTVQP